MKRGIGIGLSTADALAGALGGRLFVNSSENEGSSSFFKTEIKFKVKLTNARFASNYAEDLLNTRKQRETLFLSDQGNNL